MVRTTAEFTDLALKVLGRTAQGNALVVPHIFWGAIGVLEMFGDHGQVGGIAGGRNESRMDYRAGTVGHG